MIWLWWAPLGAASLHVFEEFVYPGGFPSWDRAYRPAVRGSMTPGFYVVVNALFLIACAAVGLSGMPGGAAHFWGVRIQSIIPPSRAVFAWLVWAALLLSNATFHLVGSIRTRHVSPGVRTGILLYAPLVAFGYWHFLRDARISLPGAALAAVVGGSFQFWAEVVDHWRSRGAS